MAAPTPTTSSGGPRSRPEILALLAAAATILLGFFLCFTPIAVHDLWWQMKTGEVIARTGRIPHHDLFGWPTAGGPWVVHEWLMDLLLFLAYTRLPHWALVVYKAGMGAVILALILCHAARRAGSLWIASAATLAAALGIRWFADIRPQMITFAGIAALLSLLDLYRRGRAARLPVLLPAVFLLWANLHGGVAVGAGILLLWLLAEGLEDWFRRRPAGRLRPLLLGTVAALAAGTVNPSGYHIFLYPLRVLGQPHVMDFIREWFSPNFHESSMLPFEILLLGGFCALALSRERNLSDVLLMAATAHLALVSVRSTPFFVITAAPVVAGAVGELARRLRERLSWERWPSGFRRGAAGAALLALGGAAAWEAPRAPPAQWFGRVAVLSSFPERAADQLAAGFAPGRMYNDYSWGGYLIWRLWPGRQVFIDGRAEVYYESSFEDVRELQYAAPGWDGILARWRVETVVTARQGNLARELDRSPRWQQVYSDSLASIYRPRARSEP
jgi:hypothetical protein